MSAYGTKVVAVIEPRSEVGVKINSLFGDVQNLKNQMTTLLSDAPETLDTLNEIAAAISDDPAFFSTMSSANTTLQNNIDALATAASTARTALQTLLQAAIDANKLTSDNAETALSGRLDTLEADPTTATALAVVSAAVTAESTARANADTALDGRLDALEADPVTKTYVDTQVTNVIDAAPGALDTLNELAAALGDDANFATTITNSIAAVQADVNQNETDADAAIAAVQADVDQNEADADAAIAAVQADVDQNEADADTAIALKANIASPTFTGTVGGITKSMVGLGNVDNTADSAKPVSTAQQTAIDAVQADVDQNEADADTAIALKANKDGDTFTGDILLRKSDGSAVALRLSRADHADMSCEWKIQPSYVSADKECLSVLAAGQPVAHFDERQRMSINKTDPDATLDVAGDGKFSTNLEVGGTVTLDAATFSTVLPEYSNDSAAATGGVPVGGLYRTMQLVKIRVS